jgi:hypothetical protein
LPRNPSLENSQEYFQKDDIFLEPEKQPPNHHRKTITSPRFHHKKPSKKRTKTRNPPVKHA